MGNAQVVQVQELERERNCGGLSIGYQNCGAKSQTQRPQSNVISSPRINDRAAVIQACKNNNTNKSGTDNDTTASTATNTSTSTAPTNAKDKDKADKDNNKSTSVFKSLKNTLKDIFDPPEPERLPPKRHAPKQLLWCCDTADEHFEYVDAMCAKVKDMKGLEGLQTMGFEFRLVHHPKTCACPGVTRKGGPSSDDNDDIGSVDDLTDSEADDNESVKEGYMEESDDDVGDNGDDEDDEYGQFDASSSSSNNIDTAEAIMVPLKDLVDETVEERVASNGTNNYGAPSSGASMTSSMMSRGTSTLSLFSLATHNTDGEITTGTDLSKQQQKYQRRPSTIGSGHRGTATGRGSFPLATISSQPAALSVMEQDSCALRLFNIPSGGTMVTAQNHLQFIPDGPFYDEIARLSMEYSQQVMLEEGGLEWITIPDGNAAAAAAAAATISEGQKDKPQQKSFGAMVSRSFLERRKQQKQQAITDNNDNATQNKKHKTLIVVTGKGQVEAGVFSRRHLLVTSMEAATSLPFIRGARERDMDIIMLDPNALGYRMGMDVVEKSLEYLFLDEEGSSKPSADDEIFILAHSMAGAQIVRFFTSNSSSYSRPPSASSKGATANGSAANNNSTPSSASSSATNNKEAEKKTLLKRIRALAFTDSNHNINWTKNHPYLRQVLTGEPSLYIKSHKVHEKAKSLGEKHHDCQFWKHRFGDIKTLWAGTHEHALTNYTARAHIWEHFDTFLKLEQ